MLTAYMDMWGLMTIKTIEEKAIWTWDVGSCWHDIRLGKFRRNKKT
jgi:hypothetical protein